jgi:hypothetical protein
MGKRAVSSLNPTLTNYAQGLAQDIRSALADFLAPVVRVSASIGQFKSFSNKNDFQVYGTARAVGGTANRISFDADDSSFNCQPQALEIAIDDSERDAAGDDQLGMEQAKVQTVVSTAVLAHEDQVITAIKAGVSATGGVGVWSDAGNDPVAEIDAAIEAIANATGIMPNRIAFGLSAWTKFRNHPKVVAKLPGAQLIGLTTGQAAQLLLNPGLEIKVGVLGKDTAKLGQTKSAANVVGSEVFVFCASPSPTVYDPSFAKTFMAGSGGITAVRQYRDEGARSDVFAIDWARDIKVVSSTCARRITVS